MNVSFNYPFTDPNNTLNSVSNNPNNNTNTNANPMNNSVMDENHLFPKYLQEEIIDNKQTIIHKYQENQKQILEEFQELIQQIEVTFQSIQDEFIGDLKKWYHSLVEEMDKDSSLTYQQMQFFLQEVEYGRNIHRLFTRFQYKTSSLLDDDTLFERKSAPATSQQPQGNMMMNNPNTLMMLDDNSGTNKGNTMSFESSPVSSSSFSLPPAPGGGSAGRYFSYGRTAENLQISLQQQQQQIQGGVSVNNPRSESSGPTAAIASSPLTASRNNSANEIPSLEQHNTTNEPERKD